MGKFVILLVALALLGTARLYASDLDGASIPFLSKGASAKTPAYVTAMGTPAAEAALPEIDFATWFTPDPAADPYDVPTWQSVDAFYTAAQSQAGWTEVCKKAGAAAGADRAANQAAGALACSDIPGVTLVQKFVLDVMGTRAALALWIRGAPGAGLHAVEGRQGEVRLMCAIDVIAREGGTGSPYAEACAKALNTAYLAGDTKATFDSLGEAYTLVAAEIARRDPTVDPEPGYYTTAGTEKK